MELTLAPKNMPSITGNFDQYKKDLIKQMDGYKDMPLTEETVAPVKSAVRQIRTTLEKIESTAVSAYFDTPKKILKAQFAELYSIIADSESKIDAVIAEDTRKRNNATVERLTNYVASKVKDMALESDVVDYVVLKKTFFNKTAKEIESLNDIDLQLVQLEKNFAAYIRAEKKINKLAKELGPTFNKGRFLYSLSKYGEGNDEAASLAEEEAERLNTVLPEAARPVVASAPAPAVVEDEVYSVAVDFPVVDRKKSKGLEEVSYTFSIPKEAKKSFAELVKELKAVGIKLTKVSL
jgi:hypothetical protein